MRWLNVSHSCIDYSAFAHASTHDAARCVSKSCSAICASPSTHHAARHSPALFALVHRHIMQLDIRLVASKSKCNCIAASSLLVMCLIYIYCRLNGPLCWGVSVVGFLLEKPTQKQHSKPFRGSTSFAQTISGLNKFSPNISGLNH